MNPVLAVFIDGLKPETVERMEFLNTFNKKRIRTELGAYSPVCHESMYTGVFPNKHLRWFTWQYSPTTSPFKLLKKIGLHKVPHNLYSKYLCYRTSLFLNHVINRSVFGFTVFDTLPLKYWSYFDTEIKKPFTEPDLLNGYPNIFNILKTNGIEYEIVGPKASNLAETSKEVKKHSLRDVKPWTYYFISDIDPLSHKYGQESPEMLPRLQTMDNIVEEKYKEFEKKIDDDFYFMLWSDHGHTKVENKIYLKSIFSSNGRNLQDYIHFLDTNYARFWFRNDKERKEVEKILSNMSDKGFILNDELLRKYHADMPDNRYGDLIFYLDKPNIFYIGEISVLGRKIVELFVSMHGYLPDYPDSDAVIISNKALKKTQIILEDITPSILHALGLEVPDYMDGESVWK